MPIAVSQDDSMWPRCVVRYPAMGPSQPLPHVTQLLADLEQGNAAKTDELLRIVYDELRRLAQARLRHEANAQTLQPTALVHEAYLRLIGNSRQQWESRGHFFAAAAEAMRRILVENARRKKRLKQGGERERVSLYDVAAIAAAPKEDLIALDEALAEFAKIDPRKAKLVELRYFAGLGEAEAADVLGISRPTAARWWAFAKAWLYERLKNS